MIVVASREQAKVLLDAGQLGCPGCPGALHPHGYVRIRRVRGLDDAPVTLRPRRARCPECAATHVLLPAGLILRRADTAQVIGTALATKARGDGHSTIAAQLGRPVSTVRRWLRGAGEPHTDWLQEQGVQQHAYRADPDILNRHLVWPTPLGDALNLLAGAVLACQQRWDGLLPVWTLIGMFTRGRLLPHPCAPEIPRRGARACPKTAVIVTTATIHAVIADDHHVTVPTTPPKPIVKQHDASSLFNVTDNTHCWTLSGSRRYATRTSQKTERHLRSRTSKPAVVLSPATPA